MKQFFLSLLGMPVETFFELVFFALMGVGLLLLTGGVKRDHASERTPTEWSWKFFFSDNFKRFLASIIAIFIAIRFFEDLFSVKITPILAFFLGLGLDGLVAFIQARSKKSPISTNDN